MEQEFRRIYSELGILNIPLSKKCKFCEFCWQYLTEEQRNSSDWSIYSPYVGEKYKEARVMFVGINMNEFGSEEGEDNAMTYLAQKALGEISCGKIRTFANREGGYVGSLLWHRILSYAVFILRELHILDINNRQYPSSDEMQNAYEYISMTNSIKCSPSEANNSKPTSQMWDNCPTFILKEELKALKPKHLVILGLENYERINSLFTIKETIIEGEDGVSLSKAQFESEDLIIYRIPHPSSSKGTAVDRQDELEELLMQYFKTGNDGII